MFECSICTEEFNNTDEVVSTHCGHVFHQRCLQDWMERNVSCPQCRFLNPGKHKIFLNFDEATQRLRDTMHLKASMEERERQMSSVDESHVVEVSRLESQMEQNEKICFDLQEKIEVLRAQHESMKLENSLKTAEMNGLQVQVESLEMSLQMKTTQNEELQKALSERDNQIILKLAEIDGLTEKVRILAEYSNRQRQLMQDSGNDRMQALSLELQQNTQKLAEAQKECTELKLKLHCADQDKIIISEQKNTLQEKLKQMQLELRKEIRHSTDLSVDRMRLENIVQRTAASGGVAENRISNQDSAGKADAVILDSAASGTIKTKDNCKFYPNCTKQSCEFYHPGAASKSIPVCKYAEKCTNIDCNFLHIGSLQLTTPASSSQCTPMQSKKLVPAPTPSGVASVKCKFYPNCTKAGCPFYHPKMCRFGSSCNNKLKCHFYHP